MVLWLLSVVRTSATQSHVPLSRTGGRVDLDRDAEIDGLLPDWPGG
jgi:hypothetical protein